MPRSPWLASAGWRKKAGCPVEDSVEAILRAIWPLLPMPVTATRPVAWRMIATLLPKAADSRVANDACRALRPSISASRVWRAEAT